MSDEQAPAGQPASSEPAPPATETAEAKTKRSRTVWPIRIFTVESVSPLKLTVVEKAPEFSEAEKALGWIKDNGNPTLVYAPVRVGPGLSPTVALKETALFKPTPAPAAPAAG